MLSRLRSWWQKTSKPRLVLIITLLVILLVLLIGGYFFNWTWTGFGPYTPPTSDFQREKTLYDWFQLAIIPVALAVGVWWLNRLQQQRDQQLADQRTQTEREIAQDNQSEAALKEYFEKMSELLLHENLRHSDLDAEVRKIARVWTLTVLPRLDIYRKRSLLQFVYESGLIDIGKSIINLSGADLTKADLSGLNLTYADLSRTSLIGAKLIGVHFVGANLSETTLIGALLTSADLTGANLIDASISIRNYPGTDQIITSLFLANLTGANLSCARLCGADLRDTNLTGADLSGADLSGVKITDEQLAKVKSLQGATMPDGSKHP